MKYLCDDCMRPHWGDDEWLSCRKQWLRCRKHIYDGKRITCPHFTPAVGLPFPNFMRKDEPCPHYRPKKKVGR